MDKRDFVEVAGIRSLALVGGRSNVAFCGTLLGSFGKFIIKMNGGNGG